MDNKEKFIEIFKNNIKRDGADALLDYLLSNNSDFFTAPASARFHSAYKGGLLEHSLNVYECLCNYLERPRVKEQYNLSYSAETIAIVAHRAPSFRNVKDDNGVWQKVPSYSYDDRLPYGHGEKSVYIVSGFMRLTREEAFAIRYHMGFSGNEDKNDVRKALEMFPLAFALSVADMEATYFLEGKE